MKVKRLFDKDHNILSAPWDWNSVLKWLWSLDDKRSPEVYE